MIEGIGASQKTIGIVIKGGAQLSLVPGEVVTGEIVNATTDAMTIRIRGKLIEARSELPLKAGDTALFKVEKSGDEVRLRLVSERPADGMKAFLRSAVEALEPGRITAVEIKSFKTLLEGVPDSALKRLPALAEVRELLKGLDGMTAKELKTAIKSSGLFFESAMKGVAASPGAAPEKGAAIEALVKGDLKGALLKLKGELSGKEAIAELAKGAKELENSVEKLIKTIEYHQLKGRLDETIDFYAPILWKSMKDGSMVIREGKGEGADGRRSCLCTVNLDLETTGRVVVSVLLEGGSVHVGIQAVDPDFMAMAKEALPTLRERFVEAGLRLSSINTRLHKKLDFEDVRIEASGLDIRA